MVKGPPSSFCSWISHSYLSFDAPSSHFTTKIQGEMHKVVLTCPLMAVGGANSCCRRISHSFLPWEVCPHLCSTVSPALQQNSPSLMVVKGAPSSCCSVCCHCISWGSALSGSVKRTCVALCPLPCRLCSRTHLLWWQWTGPPPPAAGGFPSAPQSSPLNCKMTTTSSALHVVWHWGKHPHNPLGRTRQIFEQKSVTHTTYSRNQPICSLVEGSAGPLPHSLYSQ